MKKHLVKATVLAILFAGLVPVSHAQELKFGVVDFTKCQKHHYKTYEKQDEFKQMQQKETAPSEGQRTRLKDLVKQQQQAQKDLQDPMFSDDHKKKVLQDAQLRQGEVVALQRELMEKEGVLQKKFEAMAGGIQKELTAEIRRVIDEVAKEKGLHLVFNNSFGINGVPTIPHTDTSVVEDITDEVIARLNSTAPEGFTVPVDPAIPAG